jgi:hypothetical protein
MPRTDRTARLGPAAVVEEGAELAAAAPLLRLRKMTQRHPGLPMQSRAAGLEDRGAQAAAVAKGAAGMEAPAAAAVAPVRAASQQPTAAKSPC